MNIPGIGYRFGNTYAETLNLTYASRSTARTSGRSAGMRRLYVPPPLINAQVMGRSTQRVLDNLQVLSNWKCWYVQLPPNAAVIKIFKKP